VQSLPDLQPIHDLGITELGVKAVRAVAPNPAGPTVFALADRDVLDLCLVLLTYMAWIVTALVLAAALAAGLRVYRVAAGPQQRGKPYCRRCNYELSFLRMDAAAVCPECGSEVAGNGLVYGPRRWQRLVRAVAPPVCALGILLVPLGILALRGRSAAPRWLAPGVQRLIASIGTPGPDVVRGVRMLLEIDLATGSIVNSCVVPQNYFVKTMTITPDGRHAILPSDDHPRYTLIAVRTGRIEASVAPPPRGGRALERSGVVGFASDGSAYLRFLDYEPPGKTIVMRWRFSDNALLPVFELGATSGSFGLLADEAAVVPRAEERFITGSRRQIGSHQPARPLRVVDIATGAEVAICGGRYFGDYLLAAVISPDGTTLFVSSGVAAVAGIDLASGWSIGEVPMPGGVFASTCAISKSGTRLVVGSSLIPSGDYASFAVRDIPSKSWIARLRAGPSAPSGSGHFPNLWVSPDGRYVFAELAGPPALTLTPPPSRVVVWDLGAGGGPE